MCDVDVYVVYTLTGTVLYTVTLPPQISHSESFELFIDDTGFPAVVRFRSSPTPFTGDFHSKKKIFGLSSIICILELEHIIVIVA
jgi:hypothetical protein